MNRLQTYSDLSDKIKKIYSSDNTLKIQSGIIGKYNIVKESTYIDLVGDTILGFHKTSELPTLLQKEVGVSADDAQKIISELSEFLEPVYEREKNEVPFKEQELAELQQSLKSSGTTESVSDTEDNQPELSPTEVQPMRTMEADMNRIHGYGAYRAQFPEEAQENEHIEEVIRSASQNDLLAEKPSLTDMPSYEDKEV